MSDVIVSTTESTTDVTTTNDVTTVAITNTVVEISQATAGVQGPPGANSDPTYVYVTNKTGATLAKGSIVYVSGANGTHTQVSLALATGDVTSARTLGWLAEDIANNATGLCCVEGYLDGINTQGVTEGAQLYLSPTTPGAFTETKPSAPDHMVYVGFCSKASSGNGRVFVHIQNGAELDELHDVKIVSPANNDLLRYVSGTALWENVASTAITVGSAITAGTSVYATNAGTSVYASTAGTSVYATNAGTSVSISGSITKSQVSDFTSGTVTSASTAQQAGTAVYATTAGTADYATTSGTAVSISGSITKSQVSDFTSGTVASAGTAQQAGTSVYAQTAGTASFASQAGTAVYATTSGTAVSISGSITRSQVSDFASGTVATITGNITRSQVSNFSSGTVAYATSAGFASEADTANNATNAVSANTAVTAGTASYATTSGTAVSISGSITRSQVSDFASGTVANISGTVTQAQVLNLTTDLAGKANLAGGNSFTGAQIVASSGTAIIPIVVRGTAGQSADTLQIQDTNANVLGRINASGQIGVTRLSVTSNAAVQGASRFFAAASTATDVAAIIRGASGQSANLQEWQNSAGGTAAFVDSSGFIRINGNPGGQLSVITAASGNRGFVVRGVSGQTGDLIQVQSDTGGTTVRMAMNGQSTFGGTALLGQVTVLPASTATVGVVVRGASGQSANLQEWQNSSGGTVARVTASGSLLSGGRIATGDVTTTLGQFTSWITDAALVGAVIRGAASQSANLQEWQNSSGGTVAYIAPTGFLNINNASLRVNTAGASFNARINVATDGTAVIGQVIRGAPSQSANLQEWQESNAGTPTAINSTGQLRVRTFNTSYGFTALGVGAGAATEIGQVIRAAASQSADLLQIQNSSSGTAVRITSTYALSLNTASSLAQLSVVPASTATVGVVVQGLSGQSANAFEYQNSSGGTVFSIGASSGFITSNGGANFNSALMQIGAANSGGQVTWAKQTAVASNPGANNARLYFRDGTDAGTLKLVVRAGTAGAETTILDNIPT